MDRIKGFAATTVFCFCCYNFFVFDERERRADKKALKMMMKSNKTFPKSMAVHDNVVNIIEYSAKMEQADWRRWRKFYLR